MSKWFPVFVSAIMSVISYFVTEKVIQKPKLKEMFVKANLFGVDLNKQSKEKIPEAIGVVSGCIFLIILFLFIPVPFGRHIIENSSFPHDEFVEMVAALLSICCMLLLGFADDVLDLRWRHKLLLPTIASLPLLMVYYVNFNSTSVIIPKPFRPWVGYSVHLGIFYYVYMGMLAVFCTNAINILAGINGLEVGQSIIIALSIAIFNISELFGEVWKAHQFSLYFILPYVGTSLALLKYNWYPSRVFVGDTFCYFSGMTFAVVGILGHFSKTMLLFFLPQIINFLYSVPQLFHLVHCPRHRIPKHCSKTDKLVCSVTTFKKTDLNWLGWIILKAFKVLRIIDLKENIGEDGKFMECNNLTLINFILLWIGPTHEKKLCQILLVVQVFCSAIAFTIRYPMAWIFYNP
ncbi:UDP-N-acetylglucosamine--dolichyl-phosphate N-acetylglucosaminephosphotransferase [Ischnura elegans]|uniref:UDP-N-acetylglucosamine--dolichyl-phosphate N-acetylglucosaminephosphotransferase n=1 Tax=Ischnura elegans TaxID=197161 RepID=UPI001ED89686|nr:UDP-N-acetylglucosamine--dolichyl-phosphate N-acetylglucosaminephosphotransferase [Ischnura elegans]